MVGRQVTGTVLPYCIRREQVYCLEKLNQRGTGQLGTTVMEEDTSEMLFKNQDNQVKAYKINGEMSNLLPWPTPKCQQSCLRDSTWR